MVFALAMGTVVSAAASVAVESLDNVYVNEAQLFNGGADAWFANNEIKGKIQKIGVRGWIIMGDSQVPSSFGYRIDDGDPVKCADSVVYDEAIVTATGHSNIRRDVFTADVTKVGLGEHTFTIAAWNEADEVAYGKSFTFTQELAPDEKPEALPPTLKAQNLDGWGYWQSGALVSPPAAFTYGTMAGFHIAGWCGFNYDIVAIGYRINGVETFVDGAIRAAEPAVKDIAGDKAVRYDMDGSFAGLVLGANDFDIIAKVKADDETEFVADLFANIPCTVTPADNSIVYVYDNSQATDTGYWIGTNTGYVPGDVQLTLDVSESFNGIYEFAYAGNTVVDVKLYDKDGNLLETVRKSYAGDSYSSTNFSKGYPAGTYTLQYEWVSGDHFVLGSGVSNGTAVTVGGTCNNQFPDRVPAIGFIKGPVAACTGAAWDDLKYDDTALCSEKVYVWANDPANAEALNFETGAVSNIYFRGWAQLSTEITEFGYVIDDGDVVSSADFIEAGRAGLESVPGAKGFAFSVPVSTLTAGDHKIKIVAIDAKYNTPVEIIKIKNEVVYPVAISFTINDPAPAAQLIKFNADVFQLNNGILTAAGWAGANMEAANLGYRVDDGETVMDGISFTNFNTPAEGETIKNLAGQYAFRFASRNGEIDLSGLTAGEHTVTLVLRVKDADNKQYDVDMGSKTFTITGQPDPAVLVNMSFNTVWVDGTQVCDVGDALAFLKDNPIKGEVSTIGLRGWAYIANSTIDSFGYRIDDGEPVCSASYTQDRTDLGGFGTQDVANGFNIQGIDVSDLDAGAHTVTVVVKAADGTYVDVVAVPVEITVPAPELLGYSFDWYAKNGAFVAQTGNVDQFVNEGTGIVYLHCGGDVVGFYGWAAIKNDTVSGFAYSLDGGELVSDPGFMSKTLGADFDRGAALEAAGIPNGEGFWITYNYTDYESGKHEITFYALSSNGTPLEMFSYEFSVYSVDDFTWLYNRADNSYNTGYWIGPNANYPTGDIEITFEAPDAFDGVYTAFFADALPGALVRIDLYDEDGKLLESLNQKFVHNDDGLVEFSKAYAAGTYTVDFCYISETGHFVLGSGTPLDIEYSVAGDCNVQFPNQAPSIALRNAEIVEGACLNAAWDDLKYDDTALVSEKAYKWVVDNADKLDYAEGEVAAIYFRGWAQLNKAIKGFGYIIDNGDVVTDASFSEVRGDVEASFPGGVGFAMLVPVDELEPGEHTIKIVAISEDDEAVEIFKTKDSVDYPIALTFTITGESEFALGDVNKDGFVDNKDVVVLFRELSKTNPNLDPAVADYNKDGFVDNKDVVVLFRALSSF